MVMSSLFTFVPDWNNPNSEKDSKSEETDLPLESSLINNELITFQSPALMTEVVKRLRLDMNYFVPGKFHRQVAYGLTLPVDVTINDLPENESAGFTLKIQPDGTLYLSDFIRNGQIGRAGVDGVIQTGFAYI